MRNLKKVMCTALASTMMLGLVVCGDKKQRRAVKE